MSTTSIRVTCSLLLLAATTPISGQEQKAIGNDPLPQGPKLRLGTTSYRATRATTKGLSLAKPVLSPDARMLILQMGSDERVFMDVTTGKVTRQIQPYALDSGRIQYLPVAKSIAAVSWPNSIAVIDLETGKKRAEVKVARYGIATEWVVSSDGTRAAVPTYFNRLPEAGKGIPVRVWSLTEKKALCCVEAIQNEYVRASLSADGKVLATWGRYKPLGNSRRADDAQEFTVQVWDTDTGAERCRVKLGRFGGGVNNLGWDGFNVAAAISPDGKQLAAVAAHDAVLELFDSATGKSTHHFASRGGPIKRLVYSVDGTSLAALGFDGAVQLWDLKAGQRLGVVESPIGEVSGVAIPEANRAIAWGIDGRAIAFWEAPSGKRLYVPEGHTDSITSLLFSKDGKRLTTAGADHIIAEWETTTGKMLSSSRLKLPDRTKPARSRTGKLIGWDIPDKTVLSPDGTRVAVVANGNAENDMLVLDRATGTELLGLKCYSVIDFGFYTPLFSPDGTRLFFPPGTYKPALSRDHVPVLEIGSGRAIAELPLPESGSHPFQPAFSPDGTQLVTRAFNRNLDMKSNRYVLASWDAKTGARRVQMEMVSSAHDRGIILVAPDNRTAVVAVIQFNLDPRPAIQLFTWDTKTGKVFKDLALPEWFQQLGALALSPDGKSVAISGDRRDSPVILVYDLTTGVIQTELLGSTAPISCLAFSPDGKTLASGSHDTTVLLWDLSKIGK
jgi:WD40 repeat protein